LFTTIGNIDNIIGGINGEEGVIRFVCYCKRIRNDQDYWEQVDAYVTEHSSVRFSHGICPSCLPAVREELARVR